MTDNFSCVSELSAEHLLCPTIDAQFRLLLIEVQKLAQLSKTQGGALEYKQVATSVKQHQALLTDHEPVCMDSYDHNFSQAVLLWMQFPYSGGRILYDSLPSKTLSLFPLDLPGSAEQCRHIKSALRDCFGWDAKTMGTMEQELAAMLSNLRLKQAITHYLSDRLQEGESHSQLFHCIYGEDLFSGKAVLDIVLTDSTLFFCIPFKDQVLQDSDAIHWTEGEQTQFSAFLHKLAMDDPSQRHFFPSVGRFDKTWIDINFAEDLTQAIICHHAEFQTLKREIVIDTLMTMVLTLATIEAEKFFIHDAWGHAWQETLCDFEWLYGKLKHYNDPINIDTGLIFGQCDTAPLHHAFEHCEGQIVLNTSVLKQVIDRDLTGRIGVAMNAVLSELTADIVEYKFSKFTHKRGLDFPSSSQMAEFPVRLDLSFSDISKHVSRLIAPYRQLLDNPDERLSLVTGLISKGFTAGDNLANVVDDMVEWLRRAYGPILGTSTEMGDSSETRICVNILQKLMLNIFSIFCALDEYILKGDKVLSQKRKRGGEIWCYPFCSLDLLMICLAWFYEENRTENMWHLDELIRTKLWNNTNRLSHAL